MVASHFDRLICNPNERPRSRGPPPDWVGPPPPRGCEVFVGNVPRDVFEDEVVPIFESAGKIFELRMMLDFSGTNRGYFFVRYSCRLGGTREAQSGSAGTTVLFREEAVKAIRCLDGYEIRPGKYIGVKVSADNRKLFLSGLPSSVGSDSIMVCSSLGTIRDGPWLTFALLNSPS